MNQVERILKRIEYLPPFPATVLKALLLLRDPEITADRITEVIKFDQSVAGNLLRLCNSSYFGLRRPIMNIREAVVFIGLRHLHRILMLTGARPYFEAGKPGYEARAGELWSHALAVSVISGHVMKMTGEVDQDRVFLSSLLHDIGKLVLSEFIEQEYPAVISSRETEQDSFLQTERKVLGIDHAYIGARILSLWGFPEEVSTAVGKHHEPWRDGDSTLDDTVRLADSLALSMGYGTSVDGLAYRGCAEICRRRGVSREMLDSVMETSLEEVKKLESDFGVDGEG
ncbi:MAG: HDOD domain-containing protein [Candidatus Latescibacterota bacterium]